MGFRTNRTIQSHEAQKGCTVLGDSCRLQGSLQVPGELVIDGIVEGSIKCDSLITTVTSKIKGTVDARTAVVSGTVEKEVTVQERLSITKTGKLSGRVSYGTLSIEQGGVITGECFKLENNSNKVLFLQGCEVPSRSH